VDQEVPGFAGGGAFLAAEDVFAGLAGGAQACGVGLGAGVGGQAAEGDLV